MHFKWLTSRFAAGFNGQIMDWARIIENFRENVTKEVGRASWGQVRVDSNPLIVAEVVGLGKEGKTMPITYTIGLPRR